MKRLLILLLMFSYMLPAAALSDDGDATFELDESCNFIEPNPVKDIEVVSENSFISYKTDEGKWLDKYTDKDIEFDIIIDVDTDDINTAFLVLSVYDVDTKSIKPEVDKVYLNDRYLGDLTGYDNAWSFTTFPLRKEWINGLSNGLSGVNRVRIEVDSLDATTFWVLCDWGSIKANFGFQVTSIDPKKSLDKKQYEITVQFNEDIDVKSLKDNFTLTYNDFEQVRDVSGKVEYDYERKTVRFTPYGTLRYGVEYTVKVDTGIKNKDGVNLKKCRTSSFVPLPELND